MARQAAQATGRTQTGAIELAFKELLRRHGLDPEAARIETKVDLAHKIVAEYNADPGRSNAEISSVEDLYDSATGLPR
ncbi:MAG: type II toxin-antitoxin system VapB family antitoxin [Intrasporangiaceae bacterium]|nr:type II toxin-antitoxin system VapB family antitoxin [Intrasporangiaceae bacterium]